MPEHVYRCNEIYGISRTNVPTVLSKNIFTTYLPLAASIYMSDNGIKNFYMTTNGEELHISEEKFENLIGVRSDELPKIVWESEARNKGFNKSISSPGIDMIPSLDGRQLIELEVKLTVVPTHNKRKVTEMIIRQNTQFNFAERLCYYYGKNLARNMNLDKLREFMVQNWKMQNPFIVHGLWKTADRKALDRRNTVDVIVISDFAYLYILLNSVLQRGGSKTRIGRVLDEIIKWINEYTTNGKLTYREPSARSKDHLKITLYPVDYKKELKEIFYNLRLNFNDLIKIVTEESVKKLEPERRLDASLILALLKSKD